VASVVPDVTVDLVRALERKTGLKPYVVGPTARTDLSFRYDRKQLGVDRVCAAVGAFLRWRNDLVVLDFGTSTTVNVVTRAGVFAGGLILPGVDLMLDGLSERTAQLPRPATRFIADPLQRETAGAMLAGVSLLQAGGLGLIIDDVERRLRRPVRVVATGGGARDAKRLLSRITAIDPLLASRGLAEICRLNRAEATRSRVGRPR
jgi:type III pantothenate kinase